MLHLTFFDVFCLAVLLLITASAYYYWNRPQNLPPGPVGLPFVGALPYLVPPSSGFITLTAWKKIYGPLISFYIGDRLIVVLADGDTIREALVKQGDIFAGRPRINIIPQFIRIQKKDDVGIIRTEGTPWKEQRRFALSTLRDFGFGRPLMENKIQEEIEFVVDEVAGFQGKSFDPQQVLNNSISNVICALVFGRRYDYDDARFLEMLNALNFLISGSGGNILSAHNYFVVMLLFTNFFTVRAEVKKLYDFIMDNIETHRKSYAAGIKTDDYIHAYMEAQAGGSSKHLNDDNLHASIFNLFAAGTETTATTLRWGLMYMGLATEVQEKVHAEMCNTVGPGNAPTWADRVHLPYTEAVIMEIQRVSNLAPMAIAHSSMAPTTLRGYNIPKGAIVIPLLWAAHNDPDVFEDPDKFNPDRFLEADGKTHRKYDNFMPFSIGKRICLGESMAKMELFLFFTSMIMKFRFHFDGMEKPDPKNIFAGVTITPKPFKIFAEARQ